MIPAAGVDHRSTLFGAIDYGSGELCWQHANKGNSTAFLSFVQTLATRWPNETLVLVLDNASYHKSAALRHWVERQQERIARFYLPTYSPQLNLIERLWRWLKSKLACHRLWDDRDGLLALVDRILDHTVATFPTASYPHLKMRQDL
jgi:transposase